MRAKELDSRTLEVLEFDAIKDMVAGFALSDLGREMIKTQQVAASPDVIRTQYELVGEMMDAISWRQTLPMDSLPDVRPSLVAVRPAATYLDPPDLLRVDRLLKAGAGLKRFFHTFREEFPRLHRVMEVFEPVPEFEKAVQKALTREGEVSDGATPELSQIRQAIKSVSGHIEKAFDRMIRSPETRPFLQETFVTERKGRKVLPVKSDCRTRVPGIVHDVSISGGTVFIEPMAVVGLSNELTELAAQEKEEVRRILLSLSDCLRRHLLIVLADVEVVARMDMLYGKARFAERYRCVIPGISPDQSLQIENGRHPLLLRSQERSCVPLNVSLRSSDKVLVVSGPNAGGKTTAAKTIAVLSLMAQTSTPIPASENSVLPIFSRFFADIGDYQDISLGVSTFSSHLGEVKQILESVCQRSLVVLDELGTATDPAEGAVLAEAILEELTQKGALTVVTSHLSSLKTLDVTREWARSASMGLDPQTERPNFVLSMDVPGESSGLTIARQLGIPKNIIEKAYSLMSRQERDLSRAIESSRKEKGRLIRASQQLEKERADLVEERTRCAELQRSLEEEKAKFRLEKLKFRQTVLTEKRKIVREARHRVEEMIARLPSRKQLSSARRKLEQEYHNVEEDIAQVQKAIEKEAAVPGRDLTVEEIHEGMIVWARNLRQAAAVRTVYKGKGKVDLEVDGVVFNVDADQLAECPAEQTPAQRPTHKPPVPRKEIASVELNLIGERVEKAVALLDGFLNDASMSGADRVRVIHGYGTGALRKGIREFLARHPLVDEFCSEDEDDPKGGAVTIVKLK
jgi:DNA mismatch repair protein MutS2